MYKILGTVEYDYENMILSIIRKQFTTTCFADGKQ
jgi:hypothetical protein